MPDVTEQHIFNNKSTLRFEVTTSTKLFRQHTRVQNIISSNSTYQNTRFFPWNQFYFQCSALQQWCHSRAIWIDVKCFTKKVGIPKNPIYLTRSRIYGGNGRNVTRVFRLKETFSTDLLVLKCHQCCSTFLCKMEFLFFLAIVSLV